jgi:hypothetical protein
MNAIEFDRTVAKILPDLRRATGACSAGSPGGRHDSGRGGAQSRDKPEQRIACGSGNFSSICKTG